MENKDWIRKLMAYLYDEMIQSNLITMKEYQDQQKKETNQVLARIFTTVTTQNE